MTPQVAAVALGPTPPARADAPPGAGAAFCEPTPPSRSRDAALAGWLEEHGLGKYLTLFEAHEIDLALLPQLTEEDIDRLQLPTGARRRLLVAIQGLRNGGAPAQPPAGAGAASRFPSAERRQLTVLFCDWSGRPPCRSGSIPNRCAISCAAISGRAPP